MQWHPAGQATVGNRQPLDEQRQSAIAFSGARDGSVQFYSMGHKEDRDFMGVRLCTSPRINPARIIQTSWLALLLLSSAATANLARHEKACSKTQWCA